MLHDQSEDRTSDRPASRAWRVTASFSLIGLTIGVAMLRGPVRGADDPPAAQVGKAPQSTVVEPISEAYVPEGSAGLFAFRPAAIARRLGPVVMERLIFETTGGLAGVAEEFKVNISKPGFLHLGLEDLEWVTCGNNFGRYTDKERGVNHTHGIDGLTFRTFAPFDWLGFLRQWRFDCTEVSAGGRVYYKLKGPMQRFLLGSDLRPCAAYLADDRTLIVDDEKAIQKMIGRPTPSRPAFLSSPEWKRASLGLFAVAVDNENGSFEKQYDLGLPADAIVLSLFKGVEHWTLGIDDADTLAVHVNALCRNSGASESISRAIQPLLKLLRDEIEGDPAPTNTESQNRVAEIAKRIMASLRIQHTDRSLQIHAEDTVTLADLASIFEAEAKDSKSRQQAALDITPASKIRMHME